MLLMEQGKKCNVYPLDYQLDLIKNLVSSNVLQF